MSGGARGDDGGEARPRVEEPPNGGAATTTSGKARWRGAGCDRELRSCQPRPRVGTGEARRPHDAHEAATACGKDTRVGRWGVG